MTSPRLDPQPEPRLEQALSQRLECKPAKIVQSIAEHEERECSEWWARVETNSQSLGRLLRRRFGSLLVDRGRSDCAAMATKGGRTIARISFTAVAEMPAASRANAERAIMPRRRTAAARMRVTCGSAFS